VTLCVPAPATEGSNVPKIPSVIPVPKKLPPAVIGVIFIAASVMQKGPINVQSESGFESTSISSVSASEQAQFEILYVIVYVPGPTKDGANVPLFESVIPVPDHVPPGSAALKFNGGFVSQKGPAGVIVASTLAST